MPGKYPTPRTTTNLSPKKGTTKAQAKTAKAAGTAAQAKAKAGVKPNVRPHVPPAGTIFGPAVPKKVKDARYVAKRGDNLSDIAKAHGTTLAKILKLNPTLAKRPENRIFRGTRVKLR